jgi:hypothetical protein
MHNIIRISQTDYIDYLNKSGRSKTSKVKSIFNRPEYHPAFDFYKKVREEIIESLKENKTKIDFGLFLDQNKSSKKYSRFESLVRGYLKFLGRKKFQWFDPPSATWKYKNLYVRMNPEMGIQIGDGNYIVKLYFKEIPLENKDLEVSLSMMNQTLCQGIYHGYQCAILDVERGKLMHSNSHGRDIIPLMEGEGECFIKLWENFEKKSA